MAPPLLVLAGLPIGRNRRAPERESASFGGVVSTGFPPTPALSGNAVRLSQAGQNNLLAA